MDLPAPPPGWADLPFFRDDWPRIAAALLAEPRPWTPTPADLFRALELTPPEATRVVILGQDPYPTENRATGLAFSYPPGRTPTHSLKNILDELAADTGLMRGDGDLSGWARQGVLLLNTALSVPVGMPGGHARLGWERLAAQVLARALTRPCALLLWGAPAGRLAGPVLEGAPEGAARLVLRFSHPSPLSARRGLGGHPAFLGARPFSQVNDWLAAQGLGRIDWTG